MSAQLIITMRAEFARRFARDKQLFDIGALLEQLGSARLVGAPGYSMRVILDEHEVPALKKALGNDFVVEPDYVLETFRPKKGRGGRRISASGEIRGR